MTIVKISNSSTTFLADQADTTYLLSEDASLEFPSTYAIDARSVADNRTFLLNGRLLDSESGLAVGTFTGGESTYANNTIVTVGEMVLINVDDTAIGAYGNDDVICQLRRPYL